MSNENVKPSTDAMAKGSSTTEFKITAALIMIGVALEAGAMVIAQAKEMFPDSKWLTIAMLFVGALTQIVTSIRYISIRANVKSALVEMATELPDKQAKIDFLRGSSGTKSEVVKP